MVAMPGKTHAVVVSCHTERLLDDAVWAALERLLRRRPGGIVVTPFIRPPDAGEAGLRDRWLDRARIAASLAPLGHHTHWGGATQARPTGETDAAQTIRVECEWLRSHGLAPRFFCGGGWYLDIPVAETLASLGYVDCTATTFRQSYLSGDAPRLQLAGPARLVLPSGARLAELPATHSLGMLARGALRLPSLVHLHFHDWELVDRRRAAALDLLLRLVGARRRALTIDELAERASAAPELAWDGSTITW
jgi:hypothetical protein